MKPLVVLIGVAVVALGAWSFTQNPSANYQSCFNPQNCPYPQPTWLDTASSGLWGSFLVGIGVFVVIVGLAIRRRKEIKS